MSLGSKGIHSDWRNNYHMCFWNHGPVITDVPLVVHDDAALLGAIALLLHDQGHASVRCESVSPARHPPSLLALASSLGPPSHLLRCELLDPLSKER